MASSLHPLGVNFLTLESFLGFSLPFDHVLMFIAFLSYKRRCFLPGLGKVRIYVERGPGIWDVIPLRDDDVEDKFEDVLLRLKVESFFECLALCASFIIRGDVIFVQVKEKIWSRIRGIQALGSDLLG